MNCYEISEYAFIKIFAYIVVQCKCPPSPPVSQPSMSGNQTQYAWMHLAKMDEGDLTLASTTETRYSCEIYLVCPPCVATELLSSDRWHSGTYDEFYYCLIFKYD